MNKRKLVAEFDCILPDDLTPEQFVKLMVDYLHLNRFVINVNRMDCMNIDTKVNIHLIALPSGIKNDEIIN